MDKIKYITSGRICDVENEEEIKYSSWHMRYGIEPQAKDKWKQIIEIEDEKKKKEEIDKLLIKLEENSNDNGFFTSKDVVLINNNCSNAFTLDDREIYYSFIDQLGKTYEEAKQLQSSGNKIVEGRVIAVSIDRTLRNYFGQKTKDRANRLQFTNVELGDTEDIIPSIKAQKGKGSAECTEFASLAHNLWLMAGYKSYYIRTTACKFDNVSSEYVGDGHSFTLVEYNGFKIFDMTLNNVGNVEGNPIQDLLDNKDMIIQGKGVKTKGIYVINTKTKEV